MNAPTLTILAGSNGAGKTTLTSSAKELFQCHPLLDPDAIAKSLAETIAPENLSIEAGKQALRQAWFLLERRQSFAVETTLSGGTYLKMAAQARALGYELVIVFVGTESVEINIKRVQERVLQGGHNIPEEDQRRRYPRTLANLKRLLSKADAVVLFDNSNSGDESYRMVGFGAAGEMRWYEPVPGWAEFLRG